MMHGDSPEYLSTLVPNERSDFHNHFTRQLHNLSEIRTKDVSLFELFPTVH